MNSYNLMAGHMDNLEDTLHIKRERAYAEVQYQRERDRAIQAEGVIASLQEEISKLKQSMDKMQLKHEEEKQLLKQDLINSQRREQILQQLNQEAYDLLLLHGLQSI